MYIESLHYYPVKSLGGNAANEVCITSQGILGDREWLITDLEGKFLTARHTPELLLWHADSDAHTLTLTSPDGDLFTVSTKDFQQPSTVTVWKDSFQAYGGHAKADAWLSTHLKQPCRLHYLGQHSQRMLMPHNTPLSFADGAPYLLTNTATLTHLNSQLDTPVPMARFRSNIVISGDAAAYAEESWKRLQIGEVVFEHIKPCIRCVMTTIDLSSGEKHPHQEPLKTLARTNRAIFGVNLAACNHGVIRVGDPVRILA